MRLCSSFGEENGHLRHGRVAGGCHGLQLDGDFGPIIFQLIGGALIRLAIMAGGCLRFDGHFAN